MSVRKPIRRSRDRRVLSAGQVDGRINGSAVALLTLPDELTVTLDFDPLGVTQVRVVGAYRDAADLYQGYDNVITLSGPVATFTLTTPCNGPCSFTVFVFGAATSSNGLVEPFNYTVL